MRLARAGAAPPTVGDSSTNVVPRARSTKLQPATASRRCRPSPHWSAMAAHVALVPAVPRRTAHPDLPPIEQHVEVSFDYRVLFTEDVFAADNPVLTTCLASNEADAPTRFVCVVEAGVAGAQPGLVASIEAYA